MKVTLLSLALFFGLSLASALPSPDGSGSSSCYKCEYKKDDCGKDYGGSYNSCKGNFDYHYSKPNCKDDKCVSYDYKNDDCGNRYGGCYNKCRGDFNYHYKKPYCKGNGNGSDDKHDD
ncbi:hypothetical protein MMC16_001847 [Acarospora aff. strigata]|nr:hypothetical protein [Acarospora aff. strigata]